MGLAPSVCQPSTFRMVIRPEASSAQNNMAAVSADGSTVCVLTRRLNQLGEVYLSFPPIGFTLKWYEVALRKTEFLDSSQK